MGGGVACAWCLTVARCRWMSGWGVGVDLCVGVLGFCGWVGVWRIFRNREIVISERMRACVCVCICFCVCVCLYLGLGLGLCLCLCLRQCPCLRLSLSMLSLRLSCLCLCLCAMIFSCGNVCVPDQICTVWPCLLCVCVCHRECLFIVRACSRCQHYELSDSHKLSPAHVPGS